MDIHSSTTICEAVHEWDKLDKQRVFVNCWNMDKAESYALWNKFAKGKFGLCIQSNFSALTKSIADDRPINGGIVQYFDFQNEEMSDASKLINRALYKQNKHPHNYVQEKEFRFIYHNFENLLPRDGGLNPLTEENINSFNVFEIMKMSEEYSKKGNIVRGISVTVDLSIMIESVILTPEADDWFVNDVRNFVKKFGLDIPVDRSNLFYQQ